MIDRRRKTFPSFCQYVDIPGVKFAGLFLRIIWRELIQSAMDHSRFGSPENQRQKNLILDIK